ncbi:MAG: hypothetical protein DCC43_12135 [Candidatus Brocadia sp.]|jgi:hypothetical protein|nr:hypothetical protein [Candidatus Brocadia sp.]MCE7912650.1 hypothetical protein [Candidatus Brocadia sp. AMX3]MDG5998091.1 hypothetical protein [Candidatus Brocadia sp.]OQY99215.1 MAG: hypothetical protein B6D35_09970 [Candidatus Brocadia sp. UTAMX2]RIJ94612.1 MAG: hypothetical protein DCC43_12135 [Candidatus Brocadia sp.]
MKYFPVRKLNFNLLEKRLNANPITYQRIIIGPRIDENAAVIDFGKKHLVAKTNPVTFTTQGIVIHTGTADIILCRFAKVWT